MPASERLDDDIMRQICPTAVINHGNEAMPLREVPKPWHAAMRGGIHRGSQGHRKTAQVPGLLGWLR